MRITHLSISALAVLMTIAPARGRAQIVVNGGAPNEGIGWNLFDDNRAAARFEIAGPIAFDAVRFWGLIPDNSTYRPTMYWQILADVAGAPGPTIAAEGHAAADTVFRTELAGFPGYASYQYDFGVGMQTLSAGIYWLALHDGPIDLLDPLTFTASNLIWETTGAPGQYAIQTFSIDDHWDVNQDVGLAFQLRGAPVVGTPEPSTIVLVASGLVAVVALRRRAKG